MKKVIGCLLVGALLYGCDSTRVFEEFSEVPSGWAIADTITFQVELEPAEVPFQFTSQFRTDISYPYSNLYYYFQLTDQSDSLVYSELQEVALFDAKTGEPTGSGLGDLYHVEDVVLTGYQPTRRSKLQVSLIQYMRLDTLRGIDRIGIRVNTQESD